MRKLLQFLFRKPVAWLANKFSSAPKAKAVHHNLTRLLKNIEKEKVKKGQIITVPLNSSRIVIMSDIHKGAGNDADDFKRARGTYVDAACYYNDKKFTYVALGDVEELWENDIKSVYEKNSNTFLVEREFVAEDRLIKIFGNHDMYWVNTITSTKPWLEKMYGKAIPVCEGLIINFEGTEIPLRLFLTHGHQGDAQSDGNKFSKWFVANIWSRVQAYLDVKINSPSKDFLLRDKHNIMMYEWSAKHRNTILITGHTHKPVFASLNHLEKLKNDLAMAEQKQDTGLINKIQEEITLRQQEHSGSRAYEMKKPSYFNSGCCCFDDGDITTLEIENGEIRLVKWYNENGKGRRDVREKALLSELARQL